jgi:type IX secretion system PorP/SprF family membrane protein
MLFFILMGRESRAQSNPFHAMYFQNRYLANPAMAGMQQMLNINIGYQQQWNSFPGSPKTQSLTADGGLSDKAGVGLNINNDNAGLIQTTRVLGSYAYHVPLNGDGQKLNFGLSLGINSSSLNNGEVNADMSDNAIRQYNQLKPNIDGDLGIAYTGKNLFVGITMQNLRSIFYGTSDTRVNVDADQFMAMTSYKIKIESYSGMSVEPLMGLRHISGFSDIVDAGFNFSLDPYGINLLNIYHSNKNMTFGMGFDVQSFNINVSYNTETGPIKTFTGGAFEFGLKMRLFER